jgi:cytochrome c oxidase assembly factor CtaG
MFQSLPLAVILTFSDRVIYTRYSSVDDQALAGLIMWVPGSLPLLLPMLRLIVDLVRTSRHGGPSCLTRRREW